MGTVNRPNICYVLYFGGCALVFAGYFKVSTGVSWIGWVFGMIGWALWPRERATVAASPPEAVEKQNQKPQA